LGARKSEIVEVEVEVTHSARSVSDR